MMTREEFHAALAAGPLLLDGATGTCLQALGMPHGSCMERWVLENPDRLISLQRAYAEAGSDIIYTPTLQAQPTVLAWAGLAAQTERINAKLAALSREAAPGRWIAGCLTTSAASCDSRVESNFGMLVDNYRRQIQGLLDGGVDLLVGETLLYPQEAEAILAAADLAGVKVCICSFVIQPDGSLLSGRESGPVLRALEAAGAAAVGFNCVGASRRLPALVARFRRYIRGPLLCKPNAGMPSVGTDGLRVYPVNAHEFADILCKCRDAGASLLGGCCGTSPEYIAELKQSLRA